MCLPLVFNLLSLTQVSESLVKHAVHGNGDQQECGYFVYTSKCVSFSQVVGGTFATFVGVRAHLS